MRSIKIGKDFKEVGNPKRSTVGSAGYDIKAIENKVIPAKSYGVKVNTAVFSEMNTGEVLLVFIRSSMAIKNNLRLANSVAVVDSDFRNQLVLSFDNVGDEDYKIKKGDRIAQGVFMNDLTTDDDSAEGIRKGGVGSTGK